MTNTESIRVGIAGLGRSGWGIHAATLPGMAGRFQVVAVADIDASRTQEAEAVYGCRAYDNVDSLVMDTEVDLIVVATPNRFHAGHSLQALEAGKHVVCEKPFGFTVADVDAMTAAAQKAGVVLQPFQQRRYEPDFRKVKEVCESGILGKLTFIRIAWHGFKRRWDWQTARSFGGGELYNNGPHLIDHAMELFGPGEPEVWCDLRHSLNSGDVEDDVRVILRGQNAPTVQMELTATTAFSQERWHICGTSGGLRGDGDKLTWRSVDWSQMPQRPQNLQPTANRSYNSEKLEWQEDSWQRGGSADSGAGAAPAQQPVVDLYNDLWRTIREGAPQVITPQSVRRRVAVMQKCYEQSGIPFPEGARL